MDVNVTVLARLQLVSCHEKFTVQLFVQLIENQAALRRHKRTVRIRIALVSDIADRLALRIDIVHHMDKVHLIIAVVPVALCHRRIHCLQGAFYDVVHLLNRDALLVQGLCLALRKLTEELQLLIGKFIQNPGRRLINRDDDLLHVKLFIGSVFFDYIHCMFSFVISCSVKADIRNPLCYLLINRTAASQLRFLLSLMCFRTALSKVALLRGLLCRSRLLLNILIGFRLTAPDPRSQTHQNTD